MLLSQEPELMGLLRLMLLQESRRNRSAVFAKRLEE
jgi:predicted RNA polymerase sigma factor